MFERAASSKDVFVFRVDICLVHHRGSKGTRLEGAVLGGVKKEFVQ